MAGTAPPVDSGFLEPPAFYQLYDPQADVQAPRPPSPIEAQGKLQLFGLEVDTQEPLEGPLNTRELFNRRPDGGIDFKNELRRINQELLFLFVELLAVLAQEPDSSARLLTGIKQLLLNMQYLINALRPVQARQMLKQMLQQQLQEKQEAIAELQRAAGSVDQLLLQAAQQLEQAAGDTAQSVQQQPQHMDTS